MKRIVPILVVLSLGLAACVSATPTLSSSSEVGLPKATETQSSEAADPATSEPGENAINEPSPEAVSSIPKADSAQWTPIVEGLRAPLGLETAGDERLFILERLGLVWVYTDGEVLDEPFLDISNQITTRGSEQGLLGMAFHPDYENNGYLYINYTDQRGDTVVSRFHVSTNPDLADAQSEKVLLQIAQPYGNHNGGDLAFGPDGYLYIATGDGGSGGDPQGNAQNVNTLLGKILRIDVTTGDPYALPPDNIQQGLGEIWAYGLRNPWRIHFDDATGDLYIADVGQNQWEEVNFQPAGAQAGWNFGWDLREGAHFFENGEAEDLVDPVAEYSHQLGISVTGGVVVRDPRLPEWQGTYLYGDFGSGIIWGLLRQSDGEWLNSQLWDTQAGISSFGQDSQGRVYLVDYSGRILRLDPAG